jgi:hypothetical protein
LLRPPRSCTPITIATEHVIALNAYWNRQIRLCRSRDHDENAAAFPRKNRVVADGRWLEFVAHHYGQAALRGLLAHEWAHMVQRGPPGLDAELQADCLAGAHLRRSGISAAGLKQFARLTLASGTDFRDGIEVDIGPERLEAVERGYFDVGQSTGRRLIYLCRV